MHLSTHDPPVKRNHMQFTSCNIKINNKLCENAARLKLTSTSLRVQLHMESVVDQRYLSEELFQWAVYSSPKYLDLCCNSHFQSLPNTEQIFLIGWSRTVSSHKPLPLSSSNLIPTHCLSSTDPEFLTLGTRCVESSSENCPLMQWRHLGPQLRSTVHRLFLHVSRHSSFSNMQSSVISMTSRI